MSTKGKPEIFVGIDVSKSRPDICIRITVFLQYCIFKKTVLKTQIEIFRFALPLDTLNYIIRLMQKTDNPTPLLMTLAFLGVMLCNPAIAAEPLKFATLEFPPHNFTQEGKVIGTSVDIVREVIQRMGHEVKIKSYPSKRGQSMAEAGKVTGFFALTKSEYRLKHYWYSTPITSIADVFFKRRDEKISWKQLADLEKYMVGATDGYNYAPVFLNAMRDGLFKTAKIASSTPEIQHLRKLVRKRIDLVICEINLCNHIINNRAPEFDKVDFIAKAIGPVRTFHVVFSKKWPESRQLRDHFDRVFKQVSSEGFIEKIYKKYNFVTGFSGL